MDELRHRELAGIYFLLGQVSKWEAEGSMAATEVARLRQRYQGRRDELKRELVHGKRPEIARKAATKTTETTARPATESTEVTETLATEHTEVTETPATESTEVTETKPPRDVRSLIRAISVREEPAPPPPRPPSPPPPPARPEPVRVPEPEREPLTFGGLLQNLFTERNVRWMLNLGIFIVAVGLVVLVHTQWQSMGGLAKSAILFGGTGLAFGAGHFLRKTTLKITGMGLVMLAAFGLPIDFAGLAQFKVLPLKPEAVGLMGAILATGAYVGLSLLYRQSWSTTLAWIGGIAVFGYGAKTLGMRYPDVAPLLALPLLAYAAAERVVNDALWRRPLLWVVHLAGAVVATLVAMLTASGILSLDRDFALIQIAMLSLAGACAIGLTRIGHAGYAWGVAILASLSAVLWIDRLALPGPLSYALVGAAFQLAWLLDDEKRRARLLPFLCAGVTLTAIGVLSWPGIESLHDVSLVAAALYLGLGIAKRQRHVFGLGAIAGAVALASWLVDGVVRFQHWGLFAGLYGVPFVAVSVWKRDDAGFRQVCVLAAAAAAGAALILMSVVVMDLRGINGRVVGQPALGAVMAAIPALIFGVLANREKHRFLSDLAWGSIAFAGSFALHATGIPPKWQGSIAAAIAPLYFLIDRQVSKVMPRPSLFTGVAISISLVIYATVQGLLGVHLPAAATFAIVGAFYLAVAWRVPETAHVGVYAISIAAFLLELALPMYLPVLSRTAWLMPLPVAAIIVAWHLGERKRAFALQLGAAGVVVLLSLLTMTFLNANQYTLAGDRQAAIVAGITAALGGYLAFAKPRHVTALLPAGVLALGLPVGYVLFLNHYSTGSPWGCAVVFALAPVMAGTATWLRSRGFDEQAWPLAIGSVGMTIVAIAAGHSHPLVVPDGLLLTYALATAMSAAVALLWKRAEFLWVAAITLFAGTLAVLQRFDAPWTPVMAFPLAAAALAVTPLLLRMGRRFAAPAFAFAMTAGLVLAGAAAVRLDAVPTGGPAILAMAIVMAAGGEIYRRLKLEGALAEAPDLVGGAMALFAIATSLGHPRIDVGVVMATGVLAAGLALRRGRAAWMWAAAAAVFAGTLLLVHRLETPWAPALVFPLVLAAMAAVPALVRVRPALAHAAFAYVMGAGVVLAWLMLRVHTEAAGGPVILAMAATMLACGDLYRRLGLTGIFGEAPDIAAGVIGAIAIAASAAQAPVNLAVTVTAGALAAAVALRRGRIAWLWVAGLLALIAEVMAWDFLRPAPHALRAMHAMPFLLLLGAFALHRRHGWTFSLPAMVAMTACAAVATGVSADRADLTIALLIDMLLFGLAAWRFQLPVLAAAASAAFFGANLSLMWGQPLIMTLIEITSVAMASVIAARFADEKLKPYAEPISWVAYAAVGGAFLAGLANFQQVIDPAQIDFAIGWLVLSAALFAGAGIARKQAWFHGIAAANVFAAYYLALYKFHAGPVEWYTAPIAIAAMAWGALGLRDRLERGAAIAMEVVCAILLASPSMVESFAGAAWHTWAAYAAGLLLVVGGMLFRRYTYLVGGTVVFIVETVGKAVEFLVRQDLPWAGWMVLIGGVLFAIGAAFESRKVAFVRARVEAAKGAAVAYFHGWS